MSNNIYKYFKNKNSEWINSAYGNKKSIAKTRFREALCAIKQMRPVSICDIGCGDGRLLKSLKKIDRRVGVDNSITMLKLCNQKNSGIKIVNCNLNEKKSLIKMLEEKPFELITMLGVIHYLKNPFLTLRTIKKILDPKGFLILSFRNRLFNINKKSKYFNSRITVFTKQSLLTEVKFWKSNNNNFKNIKKIWNKDCVKKIINKIRLQKTQNGVNDLFWNPYGYEIWRQYSPIELCLLLKKCGFTPTQIIPLGFRKKQNIDKFNLADTTSCLIIAANS